MAINLISGPSGPEQFKVRLMSTYRHRTRRSRAERIALGVGVPVALLTIWQILTSAGLLNAVFFPAPSTVFMDMVEQLGTAEGAKILGLDLAYTLRDAAIGFGIGSAAGFIIGVAMGVSSLTFRGLGPLMYGTLPTPKLVLYPMFIIVFGIGASSTVAICALGVFYYVCMSTLTGVRFANPVYTEVAQVFALPRLLRFRKVVAPAAWPSVITGLRLGLGAALVIVLAVEFISSTTGMGVYIWNAWQSLQVGQMFSGLAVMVIVGGLLVVIGDWLERIAVPWKTDN
jgi:NitT/TauT family transport system permease protein